MSDLHREKIRTSTPEYSRRLRKPRLASWGPSAIGQGRAPRGTGAAARVI